MAQFCLSLTKFSIKKKETILKIDFLFSITWGQKTEFIELFNSLFR